MNNIFDSTINTLSSALDIRAERQKVLASNIANQETPGYRAKDIDFASELARRIRATPVNAVPVSSTSPGHIPIVSRLYGEPQVVERPTGLEGFDRNNVGVEGEMVRLSENTIMYNTAVKMLKAKFGMIMSAIKEGGR